MRDWAEVGISRIKDIINRNNEMITFEELEEKVGPSA